jgi:anti-sigma regulatory factor (Ser/Thr protein kinase)
LTKGKRQRLMSTDESICLNLDAEAENVGVARRTVAEFAEGFGMTEPALGDIKTVVTEACANVVQHAYPLGQGKFEVEVARLDGSLSIVVRDFGVGMRAQIEGGEPSLRLGLGLISMLAANFEISGGTAGTEIRMQLPLTS